MKNQQLVKRIFTLLVLIIVCGSSFAQKVNVEFEIKNYDNDTLIVGNYYADRQLVKDTLIRDNRKDKFIMEADSLFDPGVYIAITLPDHQFIQFVIPADDQEFSAKMDYEDLVKLEFKGSDENSLFYDYLDYLRKHRPKAEKINKEIAEARNDSKDDTELVKKLDKLDAKILEYQQDLVNNNVGSIVAMLVKANFDVEIPEMEGEEEEVKMLRFRYYRDHYFDNIDKSHDGLLRTPFIHERIEYYMSKLNSPLPDSIITGVDKVLSMLNSNDKAYRFYTSYFLNKYAKMKMVGQDAIYVHMVDRYYSKGLAPWIDAKTLAKIQDNAEKLRPLLIGNTMPDITTYQRDSTPVVIKEIDADYTVLVFWAPNCGHCKKAMPDIVKFNDDYISKGVKTIGICTKGGKKYQGCWDLIEEKDMGRLLNTGDEYIRFQRKIFVRQTPKIVVLNKDKEIIIKDIPANKLGEIMDEIMKQDNEEMSKS